MCALNLYKRNSNLVLHVAIVLHLLLIQEKDLLSQNYGLGFYSYDVYKDLRTGLYLNPDKQFVLKSELELSFSLNLRSNETMYFGYIFRIISKHPA